MSPHQPQPASHVPGAPEQLDIFGAATDAALVPKESNTYQVRHRRLVQAGLHPMTGLPLLPSEEHKTCATCTHLIAVRYDRTYHKCRIAPLSRGPATDCRTRWPACTRYVARAPGAKPDTIHPAH